MANPVNPVRRNFIANLIGQGWTGVIGLAFVPIYLSYIGAEGYGLVGILGALAQCLTILDGGLSTGVARQLARTTAEQGDQDWRGIRDLVYTMQILVWCGAALLAAVILAGLSLTSVQWLKPEHLTAEATRTSLSLIALSMMIQWPSMLYNGCMLGLQQLVKFNLFNSALATLRGVGAVVVLTCISPRVEAFFAWQVVISIIQSGGIHCLVWYLLPEKSYQPRFSLAEIRHIGGLTAELSTVHALGVILMQADKLILATIMSLKDFGAYTLAWTITSQLTRVINPVFQAVQPRLTQCAAEPDPQIVRVEYRQAAQLMSSVLVPPALLLVFFSQGAVWAWTNNLPLAEKIGGWIAFQSLGFLCLGCLHLPFGLQIARGSTRLTLWGNLLSVILLTPLMYWATVTQGWGGLGAAIVFFGIQATSLFTVGLISLHYFLPGEGARWLGTSVLLPGLISGGCYAACRSLIPMPTSRWGVAAALGGFLALNWLILVYANSRGFRRQKSATACETSDPAA